MDIKCPSRKYPGLVVSGLKMSGMGGKFLFIIFRCNIFTTYGTLFGLYNLLNNINILNISNYAVFSVLQYIIQRQRDKLNELDECYK